MTTFRTYITKQESIYCGFSPELKVFSYGACSEEAINGLQDEFSRQNRQTIAQPGKTPLEESDAD